MIPVINIALYVFSLQASWELSVQFIPKEPFPSLIYYVYSLFLNVCPVYIIN